MKRTPFIRHSGKIAVLPVDNIDTDQIIPSREMKTVGRTGLADGLFAGWRYVSADDRTPNPDFVLNDPEHSDATILVAGENFGCGSSREHAVWALFEYGIRVIIARSFGDIFFNNCLRNGILPIRLSPEKTDKIMALTRDTTFVIDLPEQQLRFGDSAIRFDISAYGKRLLVEGLDPIDLTLKSFEQIRHFHRADETLRPWIYRAVH